MGQLRQVVRGEAVRLTRTRLPWWTLLTALACGGGLMGLIAVTGPENATPPLPGLDQADGVTTVVGLLGVTLFAPAVIGTAAITSEYRHRTMAGTFLVVPRRGLVLGAKLAVFGVLGLVYGLVLAISALAGLYAGAAVHGTSLGLGVATVLGMALKYGVAAAIYMLLGVGIGAVARHQLVAIGIVLGYFYLLESVMMIIPGASLVYPFLPGGATSALTGSATLQDMLTIQTGASGPAIQTPLTGALLLLAYAITAAAVATASSLRRDIA